MKHLLSIEQLSRDEIEGILRATAEFKMNRGRISAKPLAGQTWALIFSKPSTRTRVSFEVGIRELGGESIYLNAADAQLGRDELIKDTARPGADDSRRGHPDLCVERPRGVRRIFGRADGKRSNRR